MNGVLTCAQYAFAPNFYQYCGPDQNQELSAYLRVQQTDAGLKGMLKDFGTLFSYLQAIAHSNHIADPFDIRVVEAYWIGNNLLDSISPQEVYRELTEGQLLQRRIPKKELKWLYPKIPQGAKLHHSFHVFNVFSRTGHHTVQHTVDTMDQCRIGWGQVTAVEKSTYQVTSQQIIYLDGKLKIKSDVVRKVRTNNIDQTIKVGDWLSFHWEWMCDKINHRQAKQLDKYTQLHLKLANQTI